MVCQCQKSVSGKTGSLVLERAGIVRLSVIDLVSRVLELRVPYSLYIASFVSVSLVMLNRSFVVS